MNLTVHKLNADVDGKKVVRNVSFSVRPGEVHVIMGHNGSGKTSLLNSIMGHPKFEHKSGSVKLGNSYVTKLPPHEKAKKGLFLSMQHVPEIEGITLAYFLYTTNKELNEETKKIVDFYAEVKGLARTFGIDEQFLDRPLNHGLSGGEKKQSEILQLLLLRPRFALLDEIDSGVDLDSLRKVQKAVSNLRREGTGFVIVTHNPDVAKKLKPDVVHLMKSGAITQSGDTDILNRIRKEGSL